MTPRSSIIAFLAAWVVAGLAARGAEPQTKPVTPEERDHWSFKPPVRPDVPPAREWVRNPIDAFILANLADQGLKPAPEAGRDVLLRRLCFDLTGLPPTSEQRSTFLNDPSPTAYESLVDRLLASPEYGERMAQHWLDLARYADTDGFEFDAVRLDAWRYRDWVVRAFQANMPYDRFVRLQMAGDEFEPENPDAALATGFHRCYPDMVDLNDQGLRRQNALNDITETTGLVFLGLTIGCARCHDHKTDPIRQRDFYRLQAFFAPARFRDDLPLVPIAERKAYEARFAAWQAERMRLEQSWLAWTWPIRRTFEPMKPSGLTDEAATALDQLDRPHDPRTIHQLYEILHRDRRVALALIEQVSGPIGRMILADWDARLRKLARNAPRPLPTGRVLDEDGSTPPPTFLLRRGEFSARGPEVAPAFPEVLVPATSSVEPKIRPVPESSGRRSALAFWLTRPDHPLTARVWVNRLWQWHFGRGIVGTASDFGLMGDEPSHPELLDWLASELVAVRWDTKAIQKRIVMSSAYRMGARAEAADPDGLTLAAQRRRRLDAEALRDALLAVSGKLSPERGGPAVFPELPAELRAAPDLKMRWTVSKQPEERDRRSLYVFIRRNLRFPFFEAFDRPDTNSSCPRRPTTTIAPQALALFNGELAQQCAASLAERLKHEAGNDSSARIGRAYVLAFGREPDSDERATALRFIKQAGSSVDAWNDFCLALLNANEFIYLD